MSDILAHSEPCLSTSQIEENIIGPLCPSPISPISSNSNYIVPSSPTLSYESTSPQPIKDCLIHKSMSIILPNSTDSPNSPNSPNSPISPNSSDLPDLSSYITNYVLNDTSIKTPRSLSSPLNLSMPLLSNTNNQSILPTPPSTPPPLHLPRKNQSPNSDNSFIDFCKIIKHKFNKIKTFFF